MKISRNVGISFNLAHEDPLRDNCIHEMTNEFASRVLFSAEKQILKFHKNICYFCMITKIIKPLDARRRGGHTQILVQVQDIWISSQDQAQ